MSRLSAGTSVGRCNYWGDAGKEILSVETMRLRKMQQPSRVERLLEACILRSNVLPNESYQIRDAGSVPQLLQRILSQATDKGKVWSCWATGSGTWLFTCEMSLPLSRERGAPVLHVSLHDKDGALKDSGTWTTDPLGKWRRAGEGAS